MCGAGAATARPASTTGTRTNDATPHGVKVLLQDGRGGRMVPISQDHLLKELLEGRGRGVIERGWGD